MPTGWISLTAKDPFVSVPVLSKTTTSVCAKLMDKEHIKYTPSASVGTVVYLAYDRKYAGCIVIEDEIKADAPAAIKLLQQTFHTVNLVGREQFCISLIQTKTPCDFLTNCIGIPRQHEDCPQDDPHRKSEHRLCPGCEVPGADLRCFI